MSRIPDVLLFTVIITLDRASKIIVPQVMELHQSIPVIPGLFNLTYIRNMGGAFGILAGWDSPLRRVFFVTASLAALVLLVYLYRQALAAGSGAIRLALVAIGGGAFGNLYDRVTTGEVVDFLDLYLGSYHWPSFNVADSAISVGAAILFYYYLTGRDQLTEKRGEEKTDAA